MKLQGPCPFCAYAECETFTEREEGPDFEWDIYYGECPDCSARGPWTTEGHAHAAEMWDERTAPAVDGGPG